MCSLSCTFVMIKGCGMMLQGGGMRDLSKRGGGGAEEPAVLKIEDIHRGLCYGVEAAGRQPCKSCQGVACLFLLHLCIFIAAFSLSLSKCGLRHQHAHSTPDFDLFVQIPWHYLKPGALVDMYHFCRPSKYLHCSTSNTCLRCLYLPALFGRRGLQSRNGGNGEMASSLCG